MREKDFPILSRKVHGKPLIYLDNAATSQKPKQVIRAIVEYYQRSNANIHRGIHTLSEEATWAYLKSKKRVAKLISSSPEEIIYVRNTTEAINLVAYAYCAVLKPGDEIISTIMEHHSNIVPWQMLKARGIVLKFVDINDDGTLKLEDYAKLITSRTKLVTLTHASNVVGTINPVREICRKAHEAGAISLIDAAQSVPNMPVDVESIGCDFLAFSGHKMLGPTGIGVLFGRRKMLEEMQPFLYGGDMIREVRLESSSWNDIPWKFEAGTPNIAGAIGLGVAADYLLGIGLSSILQHEQSLAEYAIKKLGEIKGITIYGPTPDKRVGVVSFNIAGIHAHDIASILDKEGIAIRSGHHCAMPLIKRLGISSSCRASFSIYNSKEDIDALASGIMMAKKVFGK